MTESELIYDVGAYKREDTEFYLKKGFSVIAIETVPDVGARSKMSPVCQLQMTLPRGFSGGVWGDGSAG